MTPFERKLLVFLVPGDGSFPAVVLITIRQCSLDGIDTSARKEYTAWKGWAYVRCASVNAMEGYMVLDATPARAEQLL